MSAYGEIYSNKLSYFNINRFKKISQYHFLTKAFDYGKEMGQIRVSFIYLWYFPPPSLELKIQNET